MMPIVGEYVADRKCNGGMSPSAYIATVFSDVKVAKLFASIARLLLRNEGVKF